MLYFLLFLFKKSNQMNRNVYKQINKWIFFALLLFLSKESGTNVQKYATKATEHRGLAWSTTCCEHEQLVMPTHAVTHTPQNQES